MKLREIFHLLRQLNLSETDFSENIRGDWEIGGK